MSTFPLRLSLLAALFLLSSCGQTTGSVVLTAEPASLDFGEVAPGESADLSFTVSVAGTDAVELQEPVYSGEGGAAFELVDASFPIPVQAGDSTTFSLRFTPQSDASYAALLTLSGVLQGGVSGAGLTGNSELVSPAVLLLVGEGAGPGDDDDSAGDDDDTTGDDDDTTGDDDDTPCVDGDGDNWCAGADCNDSNSQVHPNALEICDNIDNDCDLLIDEDAIDSETWYADSDGDGYGGVRFVVVACVVPAGYVSNNIDCNDLSAESYPGATEICDGVDNDCDNTADEGVTPDWYTDADGDGYGDPGTVTAACAQPPGSSGNALDCDDTSVTTNPAAWEICDGIDNNCDQSIDESTALDAGTWYVDGDNDGYGNANLAAITACTPGTGFSENDDDCDDSAAAVYPGQSEICDGIDNNCDGFLSLQETDDDGDTFTECSGDCDDGNNASYPGATEVCNGGDEDCDGVADNGAGSTWHFDFDGDGYGDPGTSIIACVMPSGYSGNALDCDDGNGTANPGTVEQCDGIDNDCDTAVDESTLITWYADSDGDGYGDGTTSQQACSAPTGYVNSSGDCNDTVAATHPGSYEVCDGSDNDCDTEVDEASALDASTWYADSDNDGYGNSLAPLDACTVPAGHVAVGGDCDDADAARSPGTAEIWYDGIDQDCSGGSDADQDGDGHDSDDYGGDDCNDLDASLFQDCALFVFNAHTFTPCGATGRYGPSLSQCQGAYGTSWDEDSAFLNMSTQGIQRWTVPETGTYRIDVRGAGGGPSLNYGGGFPGRGAFMSGEFNLSQGDILQVMVGQQGDPSNRVGGPGGGSFVVDSSNNPLIIAGGGGAGHDGDNDQGSNGYGNADARDTETAENGANGGCTGGSNGNGGSSCGYPGGGGLLSDGGPSTSNNDAQGGGSFLNGGVGGNCSSSCFSNSGAGGFGGGGGTYHDAHPGGGGGYSGGGGGYYRAGGGGGSFNSGSNTNSGTGDSGNTGDGSVVVTLL